MNEKDYKKILQELDIVLARMLRSTIEKMETLLANSDKTKEKI